MNGFQMRGYVTGFDAFTVVLSSDGKQMVIYKHAISTIVPERPWRCASRGGLRRPRPGTCGGRPGPPSARGSMSSASARRGRS